MADGPFRPEDRELRQGQRAAVGRRATATTPPTTRCPGCCRAAAGACSIDEDVTSRFATPPAGGPLERGGRRRAGCACGCSPGPPRPRALRRFTAATGRQPRAAGAVDVRAVVPDRPAQRGAAWRRSARSPERSARPGAPVSVAETQMHYLPCGAHRGREAAERERTESFHRDGLARLVYFNPLLCVSYSEVYDRAAAAGVLQRGAAGAAVPLPGVRRRLGPAGLHPGAAGPVRLHPSGHRGLLRRARPRGGRRRAPTAGWRTSASRRRRRSVQHDGSTGDAAHNRYPTDYHCALQRIAARLRPAARALPALGLDRRRALRRGGVGRRPDDGVGLRRAALRRHAAAVDRPERACRAGAPTSAATTPSAPASTSKPGATEEERLTPELLTRWIELGALVPVMRTKRSGIAIPSYTRPQVFDPGQLPRLAADDRAAPPAQPLPARGRRRAPRQRAARSPATSCCAYPELARARAADDQYLLGPDLLAAPVTAPGRRSRSVWLPPGRWVDWWRSASFDEPLRAPTGSAALRAARAAAAT